MKYKVKSQLYADAEAQQKGAKQILDDCTWSSCAAAVSWASGYEVDFTAAQGVAAFEKATGRKDKQGVSDAGGSLAEAAKVVVQLGGKARYAKSWEDAVDAAKAGAAWLVHVQQPVGFPPEVHISKWHDRWVKWYTKSDPSHLKAGYGHCTSAGWDDGWQWCCPTRDEKDPAEKYAVPVTESQLRTIAKSRVRAGKLKADFNALLIVTYPKKAAAPAPVAAPVATPEPVAAPAPVVAAPAPAPVVEQPKVATPEPKKPSAVDAQLEALGKVDFGAVAGRAFNAASGAAAAAAKVKGVPAKMLTFLKYIKDTTGIDEALLEAARVFIATSIAVALATGAPLLDMTGADMRTVVSGGLAAALNVVVRYLNPSDTAFGVKPKN